MKSILPILLSVFLLTTILGCIGGTRGRDPRNDKRTRRLFETSFSKIWLRDVGGLVFKPRDTIIWAAGENDQDYGLFGVWFFEDETRFNLTDPNIQIGYFSRNIPQQGSLDEMFTWLDNFYLKSEKMGTVVTPRTKLPTYGRKDFQYMSIRLPKIGEGETSSREKWLTYGYVEQERYMIAFVLTAYDQIRFEKMQRFYLDIAGTYEPGS